MKSQRIFLILDIFRRKTNANTGIKIKEIQDILEIEENLQVSRMTITNDILFLQESMKQPILKKMGAHNTAYYYFIPYLKNNEVRILLDSLGANKFVSDRDKKKLADDLLGLVAEEDQRKLRNMVKTNSLAEDGEDILYTLKKVQEAIEEERFVAFEYGKYGMDKKLHLTGKSYKVVPKEVYYFNDRYYLIAYKDGELRNFRIDRILGVRVEEFHYQVGKVDLGKYDLIHFDMFGAEEIDVIQLRVSNYLLDSVVERFGKKVNVKPELNHPECFVLTEKVGINQGLIRWILKQGKGIKVLSPEKLRDRVMNEIKQMIELYE
ncbi:hypothetical protein CS063_14905 [Sporanaerobium hydrogeniformans]|uniref:Uncharacterized protein n=1 Tax=Sporanaerobium hydrogeniformans TaxID=3072179 RepID=A0AC61D9B4_9FIRM|nr:WYL domain-containing protein [Sporanaerobium hydrogeniformans]PHV69597.1 hypothetical protein CS063_14905 [Sporanaerobium hydrogeniformans]